MDRVRRGVAVAALGAMTVAGSFTVVLALDPESDPPSQPDFASVTDATAAGCTVATAARAATPVSECTACHGDLGKNSRFQMPGHDFGHPVDIDLEAARSGKPDSYVRPDQLPAFLPLTGGKITCLTCHDGRSGNRHSLAKASQKEMCLACHRM